MLCGGGVGGDGSRGGTVQACGGVPSIGRRTAFRNRGGNLQIRAAALTDGRSATYDKITNRGVEHRHRDILVGRIHTVAHFIDGQHTIRGAGSDSGQRKRCRILASNSRSVVFADERVPFPGVCAGRIRVRRGGGDVHVTIRGANRQRDEIRQGDVRVVHRDRCRRTRARTKITVCNLHLIAARLGNGEGTLNRKGVIPPSPYQAVVRQVNSITIHRSIHRRQNY